MAADLGYEKIRIFNITRAEGEKVRVLFPLQPINPVLWSSKESTAAAFATKA